MNEPLHPEVAILNTALELPADRRTEYLDGACAGDLALRQQVEALLEAHQQAEGFLESRPGDPLAVDTPTSGKAGDKIGHYRLLQPIGEGGCGVVVMAEQEEPVRRRVALKVIKPGMDTKQVIARFEAERQALALMDHPNIAKVFDAGTTDGGRPYFVMELVRGVKLTEFCDQNNVSLRDRLQLFIQVCQAVQHAHQKGIIHRDLKPSNILVTVNDGVPVPKVIDFGIAKATQGRLTDQTLFTAFEQFLGTPAYMSPEQAVMTSLDVDTRSDIYSLGVLLYELLTGVTPFDTNELLASGIDAMRKTLREKEPVRPSTRRTQLNSASAGRKLVPRPSPLASDLDWIVMKCLEKDRSRRYETANGLARDIERHLNREPVVARPPSALYRFQKSVQRNKLGYVAATTLLVVLLAGITVSTYQALRLNTAYQDIGRRIRIESGLREQALASQRRAESEAAKSRDEQRRASAQELLARRRFYAAQVNLAQQAIEAGELARGLELLETQRPTPGQPDLRTFEWYHLWGLCNPTLLRTLRGHTRQVMGLAFSSDGLSLASGSEDGTIRLWSTADGHEKHAMEVQSSVNALAFTPDGRTLVSGSWDGLVRLWDASNYQLRSTLPKADGFVRSLAISPDGRTLASTSDGGLVTLRDLPGGSQRAVLEVADRQSALLSIAVSPDSTTLAVGSDWGREAGSVSLWNLTDTPPTRRLQIETDNAMSLAFSSDGKSLVTPSWQSILLFEAATGAQLAELDGHRPRVNSAVFVPGHDALVSCAQDRTIRWWELPSSPAAVPTSRLIGTHLDSVLCLAISPDGRLLASGANDGSIKLWSLGGQPAETTSRLSSVFKVGSSNIWSDLQNLLLSPDGQTLFVVTHNGTWIRDMSSGFIIAELPDANGHGALSPDGRLLATGSRDGSVMLWETNTGRLLGSVRAHPASESVGSIGALAFSPDGRTLATGAFDDDRCVRLWDVTSALKAIREFKIPGLGTSGMAFVRDGTQIALALRDQRILILDLNAGAPSQLIIAGQGFIGTTGLVLSADGRYLALASGNGTVGIWITSSGEPHVMLKGHTGIASAVAFSPDGETVATGGNDQTVRLWDVATGQERVRFEGFVHYVTALAFTPDGHSLLAGDLTGTVRLLKEAPAARMEAAAAPRKPESGQMTATDLNSLAWSVVAQPVNRRDAERAVRWAKEAVRQATNSAAFLNTLGTAYFRAGQFQDAIQTLLRCGQMKPKGLNGWDQFVLAMSHHQLLEADQAKDVHRRAVEWWQSHAATQSAADNEELASLQAESEKLLGITSGWRWHELERQKETDGVGGSSNRIGAPNPDFWARRGDLALQAGLTNDALRFYTRAIEIVGANPGALSNGSNSALRGRIQLLRSLGRWKEVQEDLNTLNLIPPRATDTPPRLIDLSPNYNAGLKREWPSDQSDGNDLIDLPTGVQTLAGVPFDVRGLIQVHLHWSNFPAAMTGIAIGQSCRRLHFLHAAIEAGGLTNDLPVGRYVMHLANGQRHEMALLIGRELADWWEQPSESNTTFTVAWTGTNKNSRRSAERIRLFKSTWVNPRPDVKVRSVDLEATHPTAAPFLIAITAE